MKNTTFESLVGHGKRTFLDHWSRFAKLYKYKFQGQERQDELGLNWDSFKYRNYDYAIGRFMNIDPLTEDYVDWGPYVFSGNRVVDAREIEGLEPQILKDFYSGAWQGAKETTSNFVNAVAHPIDTAKRIINSPSKTDGYDAMGSVFGAVKEPMTALLRATGSALQGDFKGAGKVAGSEVTSKAIEGALIVATEGAGRAISGLSKAGTPVASEVSPNVQKALNTLNEIKAEGGTVKVNPMTSNQELNMTVKQGGQKLDLRVESHKLPAKYGGDGVNPTRHMNVDIKGANLPNKGHKILE